MIHNGHARTRIRSGPPPTETLSPVVHNEAACAKPNFLGRKQRVTITLPVALLERLRNAVYWTGHSTLAHLIAGSLDEAVTQMEHVNGGPFPARLAPLKRGRPRLLTPRMLPPSSE